jgi:peptidoglycan hydrolase-like protein with peptidoglycan-binding domain
MAKARKGAGVGSKAASKGKKRSTAVAATGAKRVGSKKVGAKKAVSKKAVSKKGGTRAATRSTKTRAKATARAALGLAFKSQGPEVEKLQDELVDLGYLTAEQKASGPGLFGPQTERALKQFQQDNHLTPSGAVDAVTEQAFLQINLGIKIESRGKVVEGLQGRLVALGFMTSAQRATGPGTFGPITQQALKAFQRQHGIEPSGELMDETYKALRTGAQAALPNINLSSTAIETLLPESGVGFTTYNREVGGADQFGRASTVQSLIELGASWSVDHPNTPFAVGDMSRKGGGPFTGHASHRDGRDADLRPLTKNGVNEPTNIHVGNYSRERTTELVKLIRSMFSGVKIFFNDPKLISAGLTKHAAGHDNHLHVRFA